MPEYAPDLVIFDCDGVLVDSEPISISVLTDMVATEGVRIDEDRAYALFLGESMASISDTLAGDFGLIITGEHLEQLRKQLYTRFREELMPVDGIGAALAGLNRETRRCVASSSQPERIRLSLEITGLT